MAYLRSLRSILTRYANVNVAVCVMGDCNECIPPTRHNEHAFGELQAAFSEGYYITNEGKIDIDGEPLIDHVTTKSLEFSLDGTIGRKADNGKAVSDHPGLYGTLS